MPAKYCEILRAAPQKACPDTIKSKPVLSARGQKEFAHLLSHSFLRLMRFETFLTAELLGVALVASRTALRRIAETSEGRSSTQQRQQRYARFTSRDPPNLRLQGHALLPRPGELSRSASDNTLQRFKQLLACLRSCHVRAALTLCLCTCCKRHVAWRSYMLHLMTVRNVDLMDAAQLQNERIPTI